jgi:hypothetical protein
METLINWKDALLESQPKENYKKGGQHNEKLLWDFVQAIQQQSTQNKLM